MKSIFFLLPCLMIVCLWNCKQDVSERSDELQFRYIEDLCCGNLMILDQQTISTFNESREDSLVKGVNLEEFIIPQNLQIGDDLLIEFEVLPVPLPAGFEFNCEVICNRHSGIPINILSLEKL